MKSFLFLIALLLLAGSGLAQQGFPNYYRYIALVAEGDSLYDSGQFSQAAIAYIAAAEVEVEKGVGILPDEMYYRAARSCAMAGENLKAIDILAGLAERHFVEFDRLANDPDFAALHRDSQWVQILAHVEFNYQNWVNKHLVIQERTTLSTEMEEVIFYPVTDFAAQFLHHDTLCFLSVNYGPFRLYFTGNSYAARNPDTIKVELSVALQRGLSILDTTAYQRGIHVILVDSPAEMQELTGFYIHGGMACPEHDLLFIVCSEQRRRQFKHELFHLLSGRLWGYTSSRMLNEGSAVYADNECFYDNPIDAIAAHLARNNQLYTMAELIDHFDAKARDNEVVTYLQSASVFKYLYETYGVFKMKQLWLAGFTQFEEIYGMSQKDFEKEWLNYILTIPSPPDMDLDLLMEHGCG